MSLRAVLKRRLGCSFGGVKTLSTRYMCVIPDKHQTFEDIGLSNILCDAMTASGKLLPTGVQRVAFRPIVLGNDSVIAAETGSGKTLSYALPLFQRILNGDISRVCHQYPSVFIAVPSKDLCRQVHAMLKDVLKNIHGANPITCEAITHVSKYWPYDDVSKDDLSKHCPDIVVCTPALMASFVRGPVLLKPKLFQATRVVILDEADLLLDGSYQKDVEKWMDALKVTRRQAIREGKLQIHEKMVQYILSAATIPSQGTRSVDRYIAKRFPKAMRLSTAFLHRHHPLITQEFVLLPLVEESCTKIYSEEREWELRVDAVVNALRAENSGTFIETDHNLNTSDNNSGGGKNLLESTMIFCNTAESAVKLGEQLRQMGIPCLGFHRLVPMHERETVLELFRTGTTKVLVCTDAAARGLDIPVVTHVIQAEFAQNVVQHIHRVGRASRGGRHGRATSIYDESSRALVESILSSTGSSTSSTGDIQEGEKGIEVRSQDNDSGHLSGSVAQSFSRKRGFRRALKKAKQKREEADNCDVTVSDEEEGVARKGKDFDEES